MSLLIWGNMRVRRLVYTHSAERHSPTHHRPCTSAEGRGPRREALICASTAPWPRLSQRERRPAQPKGMAASPGPTGGAAEYAQTGQFSSAHAPGGGGAGSRMKLTQNHVAEPICGAAAESASRLAVEYEGAEAREAPISQGAVLRRLGRKPFSSGVEALFSPLRLCSGHGKWRLPCERTSLGGQGPVLPNPFKASFTNRFMQRFCKAGICTSGCYTPAK
jgi:hypothetical protein